MSVELELELRNLKLGDHACLLFDSAGGADDWATVIPYFKEGFARGERCLLLVDSAEQRAATMHMLAAAGVNAEREVERGALVFTEYEPARYLEGRFDPHAELRAFEAMVSQTLADGFSGLRCCNCKPYATLGAVADKRAWTEFEALLSDVGRNWKFIALCRHDMHRSAPDLLCDVLRVHPKAVLGPLVCPCAYYEPPRMVLGESTDEERLRWMVDQLYDARLAQRALERAVQARDDFLSAASHEFRTPLTAALLDLQSVMRESELGPDERGPWSSILPRLRRLAGNFRRFVEIVQRLVDASQLREGRPEFHLEPVDLREATRSAIQRCAGALRRSHCDVHLVAPDESVVGQWDRMRVEQVVANLVENAAKFGGAAPIDVTVSRSNGVARLVVRDHGIGIPTEDVPRIFGRFERGAPVNHYGGFGLGLWIASTIVDAFGGHIDVRSEPGRGTTFTVDLPTAGP
jgi:signal transduction histidine kinase